MADQNLKLPDLDKAPSDSQNAQTSTSTGMPPIKVGGTTSTKEMVIACGAVLVAAIIFFFIKNAVSKMLVSNQRKSPRSADMAGWALFCTLLLAAIIAALAVLDSARFMSLPFLIPIGLAMLASLVMFVVALLSKR